jgi:hypothetical protein
MDNQRHGGKYFKNKKVVLFASIFIVLAAGAGIFYYFSSVTTESGMEVDAIASDPMPDADISASSSVYTVPDPSYVASQTTSRSKKIVSAAKTSITAAKSAVRSSDDLSVAANTESDDVSNGSSTSDDVAVPGLSLSIPAVDASTPSENNSILSFASPSSSVPSSSCAFPAGDASTTRKIIFNEIAWMGSPSSSVAEWMEIKNISGNGIDLSGWKIADASGKIMIALSDDDHVQSEGFFLLSRGASVGAGAGSYSGDLSNSGDFLAIMDAQCDVSDLLDASNGWPGGNNSTKQTLERNADAVGWHTSVMPGGTPGVENSPDPAPVMNKLTIAFEGDATGAITANPAGLSCGASCVGNYVSGTQMTITPVAGNNAIFNGWSGMCYGQVACSFPLTENIFLTAEFRSRSPVATSSAASAATAAPDIPADTDVSSTISLATTTITPTPTTTIPSISGNSPPPGVLISAVQIVGASSTNDLIRLYDAGPSPVDMSGWKLRKRSQTGTDYSLKQFPEGSVIGAGQTFTWANSAGGFSEAIGANVSSTETLSADNSVALIDASGTIVDAVAWGTGTDQYGEGSPYPTDPTAGQVLTRRSDGAMVDTQNNANDFELK